MHNSKSWQRDMPANYYRDQKTQTCWGCSSMIECLPSMCKVLGSTAYTAKKRNKSKDVEYGLFRHPSPTPVPLFLPHQLSRHRRPLLFCSHVWVSPGLFLDSMKLPTDLHYKICIPLLGSSCQILWFSNRSAVACSYNLLTFIAVWILTPRQTFYMSMVIFVA